MHRITGAVVKRTVYAGRMYFRPQTTMHKPLLKPDCLERASCNFTKQRCDMWATKSAEAVLRGIANVRVAIVERRAESRKNQEAVEVGLEEYVNVHPLSDVAAASHVARGRIENVLRLIDATLHGKPGVEIRHVIDPRHRRSNFLLELVCAKVARLVEKLREVWTSGVARRQPAKKRRWSDGAGSFRALEVSTVKREIGCRSVGNRMG